jgi:hypothetical protein
LTIDGEIKKVSEIEVYDIRIIRPLPHDNTLPQAICGNDKDVIDIQLEAE